MLIFYSKNIVIQPFPVRADFGNNESGGGQRGEEPGKIGHVRDKGGRKGKGGG